MASSAEGTRFTILDFLQKRGSAAVEQVAREIGLAPATVRRHLDILQRDRLVSCHQAHKKLGRPEFVYFLTEDGQEAGYRDYRKLLTLLLSEIQSLPSSDVSGKAGEELLQLLLVRIASQLSNSYHGPEAQSADSRLARLREALQEGGYAPEITRQDEQVQIRLCNCPFRAAALCQKSVCLLDHTLISSILGIEPVCQTTIHDGGNACSYLVTLPGHN